jgi:CO/xanthine dehydrogenase FAD-binding subunit
MEILEYKTPQSMDEAFHLIHDYGGTAIAGAAWLRTNAKTIRLGVDLSKLNLDYIRTTSESVEIGAMTTYREIETSSVLETHYGAALRDAVSHVVGVQLRNLITIGGTAAGRYGFSDLNCVLCALGSRIIVYPHRAIDFGDFLEHGIREPFLIEKFVLPREARAVFAQMKISESDFPILNVAVSWNGSGWRIAVGARPAGARLCNNAMSILGEEKKPSHALIAHAAEEASRELQFGSDMRASAEYRREILPVLVRRALMEVQG